MATCKDCLHFEVCEALEQGNGLMKVPPIHCGCYKNATDVVQREEVEKIFAEIDSTIELVCAMTGVNITIFGKYAELKKKYIGDKR